MSAAVWRAAVLVWAVAAAFPAAAEPRFAEVNGVSLRYDLAGDPAAPPLVLIHEMGMSLESWDDVVPALASGHRVLRYDLHGFGQSEKLAGAVTIEQEVADLDALIAHSGLHGRVVLVGGAVGGAIALNYAALHPDKVRGLVAISPAAGVAPAQRPAAMAAAAALERRGIRALLGDMQDIYPDVMRMLGEAVHAVFAADRFAEASDARLRQAAAVLSRWGVGEMDPTDVLGACDRLQSEVRRRWSGAMLRRECPVAARVDGRLVRGRIDLLVDSGTEFAIIDHKSFPGSPETWERRAVGYGAQLELYAEALARARPGLATALYVHLPIVGTLLRLERVAE